MSRWNEETRRWDPHKPESRTYPSLPSSLKIQIDQIQSSSDGMIHYWPAQVTLRSGVTLSCVYFADVSEYIKVWGVWPDEDSAKREVRIEDIAIVTASPSRLPAQFAQQLYRAGESGMGYLIFELLYSDGSKSAHLAGNAINFVALSNGKQSNDIVKALPHAGRDSNAHINAPDYAWCLFNGYPDRQSSLTSLFKS